MSEDLPLLDLFLQLREADLPLGIDEYRLLLRALQLGYGTADAESLRRLCHTLWIKTPTERHRFDYHFDLMLRVQAARQVVQQPQVAAPQLSETPIPSTPKAKEEPVAQPEQPETGPFPSTPTPSIPSPIQPSGERPTKFVPILDDEVQMAQAVQSALMSADLPRKRFILSGEYYPVTRRQMKQSWRYLRRMVKEGPAVVLNVEKTVRMIGRRGFLLEPVLEPPRINRTELLMAIDQEGSMVPFHSLSRQLAETVMRGGRLGRAGIYYFHNCPLEHLYSSPALVEAQSIDSILGRIHRERTVVLIFSDAGAARGGLSLERIEMTRAFLWRFRTTVRRIAWLNPMPASRWPGTTAAEIAKLVPMFEMDRRGMDSAIDALRGRYTVISGRL